MMNKYEIEVKEKGQLPSVSFPGTYPIYYLTFENEIVCSECATKFPEQIAHHEAYMEGAPLHCEGCNAVIESAYGDPDEEENDLNEMRIRLEASEPNDFDDTPDLDAYGDPFED